MPFPLERRVLFVSRYAEPYLFGGNNNVYRQAIGLSEMPGLSVEILTWPLNDGWRGPVPMTNGASTGISVAYTQCLRDELRYHVVDLPRIWNERVLSEREWAEAVSTGIQLLRRIRPDVVHLQHWAGMWWILESAQRLSIPTVYSAHDWGIACLRTLLITGQGHLCDGTVELDKCEKCIFAGRNLLGKLNEVVVRSPIGEAMLNRLHYTSVRDWLMDRSVVRTDIRKRLALHTIRVRKVVGSLNALLVANSFGHTFFSQFGLEPGRIHVLPWYYDTDPTSTPTRNLAEDQQMKIGYIGRISPDKGLHILLNAVTRLQSQKEICFVIAGAINNDYAKSLMATCRGKAGKHQIRWLGWLKHDGVASFYNQIDLIVIPSLGMDNTPLSLVEAIQYGRPVIASDVPTFRDFIISRVNGRLFPLGDADALADIIDDVAANPNLIGQWASKLPVIPTRKDYVTRLAGFYEGIVT